LNIKCQNSWDLLYFISVLWLKLLSISEIKILTITFKSCKKNEAINFYILYISFLFHCWLLYICKHHIILASVLFYGDFHMMKYELNMVWKVISFNKKFFILFRSWLSIFNICHYNDFHKLDVFYWRKAHCVIIS